MNKSVPMAAAGFAVLALAASSLTTGTVANAAGGGGKDSVRVPAMRAQVSLCTGGAATSMRSRAMDYQSISSGTTADIEGSQFSVKGPKRGTDTVLVTISTLALNGGSSDINYLSLYKDGIATSEGQKYFGYGNTPATAQFCTKIGRGQHTLVLRLQELGGGGTTLYNPTVTYQRFN